MKWIKGIFIAAFAVLVFANLVLTALNVGLKIWPQQTFLFVIDIIEWFMVRWPVVTTAALQWSLGGERFTAVVKDLAGLTSLIILVILLVDFLRKRRA